MLWNRIFNFFSLQCFPLDLKGPPTASYGHWSAYKTHGSLFLSGSILYPICIWRGFMTNLSGPYQPLGAPCPERTGWFPPCCLSDDRQNFFLQCIRLVPDFGLPLVPFSFPCKVLSDLLKHTWFSLFIFFFLNQLLIIVPLEVGWIFLIKETIIFLTPPPDAIYLLLEGRELFCYSDRPQNGAKLEHLFISIQGRQSVSTESTYGFLPVFLISYTCGMQSLKVTCGRCHNCTPGPRQMLQ